MKPARAASRRFVPGSPFNTPQQDPPPIETFAVRDQVNHDKYGLGRVILVEDDAIVVDFGSDKVRIRSPFARLAKL
jgi:hypothetical protein